MTSSPPGGAPGWGPAAAGPPGARDVITGEAVALELRLAKVPSRGLALALDLAVMIVVLIPAVGLAAVAAEGSDDALGAALFLTTIVGVVFGYPILFEVLTRGRTPGKMALGLRVVRDDGGPIRFRHALVRALSGIVDFFLVAGAVAVLVSLGSARGKRVGDHIAGTVVIRERVPHTAFAPAVMPPALAGWAAALPVTRLPDALAMDARQVLSRRHELDPDIAGPLLHQLAGEVATALSTPVPPGQDPADFLAAVLAERRNRELAGAGIAAGGPVPWGVPPPATAWGTAGGWPQNGGWPQTGTWGTPTAPPAQAWGDQNGPPPAQSGGPPAWGPPPTQSAGPPAWGPPPAPGPSWGAEPPNSAGPAAGAAWTPGRDSESGVPGQSGPAPGPGTTGSSPAGPTGGHFPADPPTSTPEVEESGPEASGQPGPFASPG